MAKRKKWGIPIGTRGKQLRKYVKGRRTLAAMAMFAKLRTTSEGRAKLKKWQDTGNSGDAGTYLESTREKRKRKDLAANRKLVLMQSKGTSVKKSPSKTTASGAETFTVTATKMAGRYGKAVQKTTKVTKAKKTFGRGEGKTTNAEAKAMRGVKRSKAGNTTRTDVETNNRRGDQTRLKSVTVTKRNQKKSSTVKR